MGHPMAKKSFRKRGDKFLKHQSGRFGFNQEEEQEKPHQEKYFDEDEEETSPDTE